MASLEYLQKEKLAAYRTSIGENGKKKKNLAKRNNKLLRVEFELGGKKQQLVVRERAAVDAQGPHCFIHTNCHRSHG